MNPGLVLASTSPFRRELLQRLALPFDTCSPQVDETPKAGEAPGAMVARLAEAKARAGAEQKPDSLIIGSDQCAELDGRILGKPGSHQRAVEQLGAASGRTVVFHTGLCLLNAVTGEAQVDLATFRVRFRSLSAEQIENYLRKEQPYQCAGSIKSEGLGIALFEAMEGDDPTALVGLPLIRLCSMMERAGLAVV
ncbi:Maf family protein [Ectothiorhodospira variabilis]|uniref:Maf family protein n=1 Tax=Ectothiorhodospira variabilis TaxID=505694 RepID=UPI001EFAB85A|nr:Maf family nucleotide pyrophosphatase [Ectothiorhodospira variabilis]MCG5494862.1 Maf family nucleotide pyrophosphatase [Ectothiorhodospira variabilis]MCG5497733.1 Maf family nucleotide pyrophosphatase [Ectothiorhodospira variabilis]MCG5504375.1 Maf family nucleotide pyrophosphatase [Ectothiorhodospira variabilis]MCG5507530.1 Maf family nucleotide pyrophosphatase [Ectothiorhodospira variabilis]